MALIPKQALDYIKNKKLKPAFSYKDVWNEEHAAAFTVAKAMQLDVLSDIKNAVEKAIENGMTFEQFKKELKLTLMQKGWWGRKEMTDPLTGETVNAQLGSDRRLKTIYSTNLRSAYQKGQYDRTMQSDAHPYLMYRIGASVHHREQHLRYNNLILPKDDPLWNSIFPPNGYGCKCYTVAVTEARKQRYEQSGIPYYNPDTQKTVRLPVQTTAPKVSYKVYENVRKGIIERMPAGITPGFNWNQGLSRDKQVEHALKAKMDAQRAYLQENELFPKKISKNDTGKMATYIREHFDSKVPNIAELVQSSSSTIYSIEELQKNEKMKPITEAIQYLENNCKEASFKNIVVGNRNLISENAIAVFNPFFPDTIFLNSTEVEDFSKIVESDFQSMCISTNSPMHYIFHEAGHKWVLKNLTNRYKFLPIEWITDDDSKYFESEISWNAGRSPAEAVAELFAMKMVGTSIPSEAVKRIANYARRFAKWLE